MGLLSRSTFYYGHAVEGSAHFISIDEGAGEISVNLTPSGYTFTELALELERALNSVGTLTYTISANRLTRKYTITASANFSILAASGDYFGSSLYTVLGFNSVDKTGASSYVSDFSTGLEWRPQLPLFSYVPSRLREGSLSSTQDESGNGNIQVITFGTVNYMEFEAKFITDRKDQPVYIENDQNAVANAMGFLSYVRKKNRFEFMEDRNVVSVFEKMILQKTSQSANGLEVKLEEMTGSNLQDYYETKLITCRKVV
jgi:hypothetical protein